MQTICSPFPDSIRTIGVFAPAKAVQEADFRSALDKLRSCGVAVKHTCSSSSPFRYFAGTDEQRLRNLQQLLADPEIDLLLAARGGFGCTRILEQLDWVALRRRNLPVVGYSDLTALHLAALKFGCRNHIQGPMLCTQWGSACSEPAFSAAMESLSSCLRNCSNLLPSWHQAETLVAGKASGPLIPCNLTLLCSLIGTAFLPDFNQAILVLEDIHVPAHALERYLNQLRQCGILGKLSGLIFGQFSDCEDSEFLPEIFAEYASFVHGAVLRNLAFGHQNPSISLPVGKLVHLEASADHEPSLTLDHREQFAAKVFLAQGQDLPYRLLEPKNIASGVRYPLVLFLHGAGERGIDNQKQLVHVAGLFSDPENRRKYPCFVLAPQCASDEQWVDRPWSFPNCVQPLYPSRNLVSAMQLLDQTIRDYPVDPGRIYIMGLSMGGYGTWDAITRFPERFAAAIPICGGGDISKAAKLTNLPIWAFHGGADDAVPVKLSRDMCNAIQQQGGNCRYTEFPGTGHNSWTPATEQPELLPWLFAQKKEPAPLA
ncbi:MAG: prolyl oligopeptidase family serine peptidase [Lentisphaerae bacterium]|jgi:muramoyltetrapeptide carboxypeptidase LdcA involved in peptidoglycan recycling/poly(3-hydroxybutyrate) depolymerase|nr:prolyl oligopeptidase family serine peptidase [Lentisphaerota bacterium]